MTDPKGTALITGASSGLGLELARLFAADGHNLVLVARREDRLRQLADELSAKHSIVAHVVAADLSDPGSPAVIQEQLESQGIQVDYLVNNAGFGSTGFFAKLDHGWEMAQVQVNMVALTDLTHRFLGPMVQRGRGRVLNIASTASFQPGPFMAVYYATKAYVLHFSEALAHELRKSPVTVTAHCPGPTATEFGEVSGNGKNRLFQLAVADAESVCRHAYKSMMSGRAMAVPGLLNWLGAFLVRLSPRVAVRWLAARLNRP
ncbi:MAG: short-subunit dehydrogenase [Myxococcota bacterium]|jgi:short-subunit dehydrogenase